MKQKLIYAALVVCVAAFSGCSSSDDDDWIKPINWDKTMDIAYNSMLFAYQLLQENCRNATSDSNFVISPISVYQELGGLICGAKGETQKELISVTRLPSSDGVLHDYGFFYTLPSKLAAADSSVSEKLSNLMWLSDRYSVAPSYDSLLTEAFHMDLMLTPSARAEQSVSGWLTQKTGGAGDLVEYAGDAQMMLFSAPTFKAQWSRAFDKSKTKKEQFTCADGSVVEVDMMNAAVAAKYVKQYGFAMADIEFGNGAYALRIILPNHGVSIDSVLTNIQKYRYDVIRLWQKYRLEVKLPKFSVTSSMQLSESLKAMGVKRCFSDSSDFSGISSDALSLNGMAQQCSISIDEQGAGVSESDVEIGEDPMLGLQDEFFVNRPFLFAVMERSRRVILLAGRVSSL